jgi:hypothetical protein
MKYLKTNNFTIADAAARRNAAVLWVDYGDVGPSGQMTYYVTPDNDPPFPSDDIHVHSDYRSATVLS